MKSYLRDYVGWSLQIENIGVEYRLELYTL